MTPLGITPSPLVAKTPDSERSKLTAAAQKFEAIFRSEERRVGKECVP